MTKLSFGQKLMLLRKGKKLSQKKLAELLNLGIANIARYESNARLPHAKTIVDIANFFSVSTDYLLKEDENLVAIEDRELLELTSKADKLSDQDKDFIKNTIQNFLKNKKG
ncbi:MAG: helix-turn-helix transcriptional regulator [Lentisphaerae bacterium]|nr:helix-turn-helix transcriptional regulator [Lentisphaerota bacterium]